MHFINLRIEGDSIDFDAITSATGADKVSCLQRGKEYTVRDKKFIAENDIFQALYEIPDDSGLNAGVQSVVNKLYESCSLIKSLSSENDVTLWLTLYPEEYQLNFNLTNDSVRKMGEMGIDFDLSVMSLQKFYDGLE